MKGDNHLSIDMIAVDPFTQNITEMFIHNDFVFDFRQSMFLSGSCSVVIATVSCSHSCLCCHCLCLLRLLVAATLKFFPAIISYACVAMKKRPNES